MRMRRLSEGAPAGKQGQWRILCVGDPQAAARLRTLLQHHGCHVDMADGASPALAQAAQDSYDLVVLNTTDTTVAAIAPFSTWGAHPHSPLLLLVAAPATPQPTPPPALLEAADYLFPGDIDGQAHLLAQTISRLLEEQSRRRAAEMALESLRQDNRNLLLLTRLAHLLTSTLNLEQVISQLVQTITEIVVTEGSSVWLWSDSDQRELVCAAMYLDGKDITSNAPRMNLGQGVVGWVAQHGQPVNVQAVDRDPRFSAVVDGKTGYNTMSILAVPLITRDRVIGVLEFVNKLAGHFNERDQEVAGTVAAYAANAIENARLMASVSQQRDLLEVQNDALDAFAYSVAHDLKNPLTMVVGYADMLRDDFATFPIETVQESLNTIVEYGIKMSSIVDALLLLASVGTNEEVELEPVDMAEITESVVRRMANMVAEYRAEIVFPDNWPLALGYSPWLEEVWYNYLSNGIKYGGRPPRLVLGFDEREDGIVRYWVQDNGPGLGIENPMAIFHPQARRRRSSNGHGLGLSIVQRIVDRLGGQVGAESLPGGGSRFSFTLSAVAKAASMA